MNSRLAYTIAGIVIVVAAGIIFLTKNKSTPEVSQNTDNTASTATPSPTTNSTNDTTMTDMSKCADGSQKDANGRFKPSVDISNKTVTLDTSMGKIEVQFYDKDAPKAVQNFICLVEKGYYDGIKFHRVAHGFVIQAGDPTGTGSGGESIYGAKFEDELYPDTASYKAGYVKGTLAMANAGPNTNGSQFFIMTSDVSLPNNYTIFGKVSSGMDVVDKIGKVPVTPGFGPEDGAPITPIVINKATVK
jgi:cyclophilin family peptidyl-prolyl cis-trans isomerase